MRSLVITIERRGIRIGLLPLADIVAAGQVLVQAAYSYDPAEVHAAVNAWYDLLHAPREHWRCVLFGHTGDGNDSGYHVCARCGLHAYWHTPEGNPEATVNYDHCAVLLRPWWRFSDWAGRVWQARPWRRDDVDLPF